MRNGHTANELSARARRRGRRLVLACVCISWLVSGFPAYGAPGTGKSSPDRKAAAPTSSRTSARFGETIHQPEQSLGLTVDSPSGVPGETTRVGCGTCHGLLTPSPKKALAKQSEGVHAAIKVKHGELTCRSCHVPPRFDGFRLVSGEEVAYDSVVRLCAQCHGAKWTDFQHGAHGGMSGHWDLNRGPRVRNHCLDCHDAHAPAIRPMWPAPAPRTRGGDDAKAHGQKHNGGAHDDH